MVVCLASYFNWGLSLLFSTGGSVLSVSAALGVILISFTLVSVGLAFAFSVKPVRVRNIFSVVFFVFAYWFLQMFIATKAFFPSCVSQQQSLAKNNKGWLRNSEVWLEWVYRESRDFSLAECSLMDFCMSYAELTASVFVF